MQLVDRDGTEVAVFTKDVEGTTTAKVGGVKVYRALLTQTSTNAPIAVVLENTLNGDLEWAFEDDGRYTATLSDAFPEDKTFISINACADNDGFLTGFASAARSDANTLKVRTVGIADLGVWANTLLLDTAIEILVYP
jgi:hypothetical protein